MKIRKCVYLITLIMAATVLLYGCKGDADSGGSAKKVSGNALADSGQDANSSERTYQLAEPQSGDTIAVMHIKDYGDITIRLFSEEAPKAVENFVTHAKNGYYDGVTFHRVIDDVMIQGGDPEGNGTGGESIWGKPFEDEFVDNLMPIRGALCMANAGSNTNGSQFFIVQAKEPNLQYASIELTEEQKNLFANGGTPHLVYKHTVFGQVVDGMDIVDEIAVVDVDANDKPVKDVVITSIDIKEQD